MYCEDPNNEKEDKMEDEDDNQQGQASNYHFVFSYLSFVIFISHLPFESPCKHRRRQSKSTTSQRIADSNIQQEFQAQSANGQPFFT